MALILLWLMAFYTVIIIDNTPCTSFKKTFLTLSALVQGAVIMTSILFAAVKQLGWW